jgi:hypothetical protein
MSQPLFVELTKVAATDSAQFAPEDPALYLPGSPSNASLPLAHTIKGWLRSPPTVGEPLVIDRTERNGLPIPGIFVSSPVVTHDAQRIQTSNSIYTWRALDDPSAQSGGRDCSA